MLSSRLEAHLESLQQYADAAAGSVGAVAGIVVGAATDIVQELGSLTEELAQIHRRPPTDD